MTLLILYPANKIGHKMEDYAQRVCEVTGEISSITQGLLEDKSVGVENMNLLNLPQYESIKLPLETFISNTSAAESLNSNEYYIVLSSKDGSLPRKSKSGLTLEKVIKYIKENIKEEDIGKYNITINQFFPNKYGGNVLIRKDGSIIIEFGKGKQSKITRGQLEREEIHHVKRLPNEISFEYSFDDIQLRHLILKVLKYIPNSNLREFLPGYYEFIVGEDSNNKERIVFIDARFNDGYIN